MQQYCHVLYRTAQPACHACIHAWLKSGLQTCVCVILVLNTIRICWAPASRFLLQHIAELGYIADESLDALGLLVDKQSVLLLDHAVPTILAFQQMYAKGMTGAAIKAEGNQMIANLSISDLR